MTTTERATLAAIEHYDRRAAELRARVAPYQLPPEQRRALAIIDRARSAELLDPEPVR